MSDTQKIVHLPDLPVYQDVYCSQELTDRLCRYVCENKPEFVQELIEHEKVPFPNNRDGMLYKTCKHIEIYIRDEAMEGRVPELSMLGRVDFIYEMERRVRNSMGLFDIPVLGNPLAPTPKGPFPRLIDKPIHRLSSGKPKSGLTQELADKYTQLIYENNLETSYIYCEHKRRLLGGGLARSFLFDAMRDAALADGKTEYVDFLHELSDRLWKMCNLPDYEQIEEIAKKGLSL